MKKKKLVVSLVSTILLASIGLTSVTTLVGQDSLVYATSKSKVSSPIGISKYGTVVKDNYSLWQNFNWKKKGDSSSLMNQVVQVKYAYEHENGSFYYSLYNKTGEWLGYINSAGIRMANGEQGTPIKIDKKIKIVKGNYSIWQNFNWKKKNSSSTFYNQVLTVKYCYNHMNGSKYYSLYNDNGEWLGYINSTATTEQVEKLSAQGKAIKTEKYVTIVNDNYNIHSNFNWKKKNTSSTFKNKTLKVSYMYQHQNGETYYSLYDVQGIWQGYINARATKEGEGQQGYYLTYNNYVMVKNEDTLLYNNLKTMNVRNKAKGLTQNAFLAKVMYNHYLGISYYSLYDHQNKWLGYVEGSKLTLDVDSAGKGYPTNREVSINKNNEPIYQNFNWKVKNNSSKLVNQKLIVKRYYEHANGKIYYSIFDTKNVWQGYIPSTSVSAIKPVLTGVKNQILYVSDKEKDFSKEVKAVDYQGKELKVSVIGDVNVKKSGTYPVVYTAVDEFGNKASEKTTIKVIDDYAPIFTGVKDIKMKQTAKTIDLKGFVVAKDFEGKEIEYKIKGNVDGKKIGKYTIEYIATDKRQQTTTVKRDIVIEEAGKPELKGVIDSNVKKSEGVFDPKKGISAKDYKQETLDILVEGTVDMSKSGQYDLIYSSVDELGQTVSQKRVVTVVNDLQPIMTGVKDASVNINVGAFSPRENVSATDSDGKVINYTVTGEVNPTKVGQYKLNYYAVDDLGNEISINRTISIIEVLADSVTVSGRNEVKTSTNFKLDASIQPLDVSNNRLTWYSSNPSVATVAADGSVVALSEGRTTITAESSNGVKGDMLLIVDNDIKGYLYINSMSSMNDYIKSLGFLFINYDIETLYVQEIIVSDGSFPSSYSRDRMIAEGVGVDINPREQFSLNLSSRFGWDKKQTVVKVRVQTTNGIEKIFEAVPR